MLSYALLISGFIVLIYTKAACFCKMKKGLKALKGKGDVSPFKAMTTSLAASLGIGNIIGVAQAIIIGGPGSIFWMWISAIMGCSLKYAEGALAVKYKGAINYIKATKIPLLAIIFTTCGFLASLGVGNMIQINTIANVLSFPKILTGIIVALFAFVILSKGTKGITKATSIIIPFITFFFVFFSFFIILSNYKNIPNAFCLIFSDAFSGKAIIGGSLYNVIRIGLSRGLFSNEAGMGTSGIAHSMVEGENAHNEGIIASLDPIIDTLFLCTLTALVILTSNNFSTNDILLVECTYGSIGSIGLWVLNISIVIFGFATIIGWYYYGRECFLFLFKKEKIFLYIYIIFLILGAIYSSKKIWIISDVLNHLMAIPNIIAIYALLPTIKKISKE